MDSYELIIDELRKGKFSASLGEELLVPRSRTPLLDAARVLKERGAPPEATIYTRWRGSPHWAMRATVGWASGKMLVERGRQGLRFETWTLEKQNAFRAYGASRRAKRQSDGHPSTAVSEDPAP